jgi:hypothetical protein
MSPAVRRKASSDQEDGVHLWINGHEVEARSVLYVGASRPSSCSSSRSITLEPPMPRPPSTATTCAQAARACHLGRQHGEAGEVQHGVDEQQSHQHRPG